MKNSLVLLSAILLVLTGCASTRAPEAEIVVREFKADAAGSHPLRIFGGRATLGGGRVSKIGKMPNDCVKYEGDKFFYTSEGCMKVHGDPRGSDEVN